MKFDNSLYIFVFSICVRSDPIFNMSVTMFPMDRDTNVPDQDSNTSMSDQFQLVPSYLGDLDPNCWYTDRLFLSVKSPREFEFKSRDIRVHLKSKKDWYDNVESTYVSITLPKDPMYTHMMEFAPKNARIKNQPFHITIAYINRPTPEIANELSNLFDSVTNLLAEDVYQSVSVIGFMFDKVLIGGNLVDKLENLRSPFKEYPGFKMYDRLHISY